MVKQSLDLLEEMNGRLSGIAGLEDDDLSGIQLAIETVSEFVARLRDMLTTATFDSPTEEIRFFKWIKPQFDGKLIFYLLLLRLQTCQTTIDRAERHKIYLQELENLQPFYEKYYAFWQYYRLQQTHLDEHYFLRQRNDQHLLLQEEHIHLDWQANVLMSVVAARIQAYDYLRDHALAIGSRSLPSPQKNPKTNTFSLRWTSAKIGLIELLYALQEYGAFNNSQVDIKKIADYFSLVFNVYFGNVYKTYEDIRLRKKGYTPFLDALKAALEKRVDRDNENAM